MPPAPDSEPVLAEIDPVIVVLHGELTRLRRTVERLRLRLAVSLAVIVATQLLIAFIVLTV